MTSKKVGGIYHWKGIFANSFDLCYHCFTSISVFSTRALVSVRVIERLIFSVEMATPKKIKLRFLKCHHKALCCLTLYVTSQYNLDPSLYQCGHAYLPHTQNKVQFQLPLHDSAQGKVVSGCSSQVWSSLTARPFPTALAMQKDLQEDTNTVSIQIADGVCKSVLVEWCICRVKVKSQ